MTLGSTLRQGLQHQRRKQHDLALETNYSEKTVSAWANDTRNITKEARPKVAQSMDYPDLYLEIWMDSTGGVGMPVLNGPYIERRAAAMRNLTMNEIREAFSKLEAELFAKPVDFMSDQERERVLETMRENLDAACFIVNFVAVLCRDYEFSMQQVFKDWLRTLEKRKWRDSK